MIRSLSITVFILCLAACATRSMEPDEFHAKLLRCAAESRCWRLSSAVLSSQFEVAECGQHAAIPPESLTDIMPGLSCNEVQ
jgi:hypothetical protein